jgi:nucleotide-binding universal stress UspA family protein
MSTGRIVVGVDGSESSKDALRWARTQADLTGSELVAVTAWSYPVAAYPTLAGYVPMGGDALDLEKESRTALETLVKETLGDSPVTLEVIEGHPANALLDVARDATLVVVGSRGHGGFGGSVIGSISQYVVTHARCPVVIVRHPKAESAR